MNEMRSIQLRVDDDVHEKLKEIKGKRTWEAFLVEAGLDYVKVEKYDEMKKIDNKIIYDLSNKLEAIKNWHKAQIGREVDPQDIRELGEILEAEV